MQGFHSLRQQHLRPLAATVADFTQPSALPTGLSGDPPASLLVWCKRISHLVLCVLGLTVGASTMCSSHDSQVPLKAMANALTCLPEMPLHHLLQPVVTQPLLTVQCTVFPCRSIILAVSFHHMATDGAGFFAFMDAWGQLAKTAACHETPFPCNARHLLAACLATSKSSAAPKQAATHTVGHLAMFSPKEHSEYHCDSLVLGAKTSSAISALKVALRSQESRICHMWKWVCEALAAGWYHTVALLVRPSTQPDVHPSQLL